MSNGMLFEVPGNQILNPLFLDLPEPRRPTAEPEPLRCWSHSGDVTVRDWPTPIPIAINFGQCVALGPGGELGQLLGFMPTQHDLWFAIQADDATTVDLTVTVKYTDRDMNVREIIQTKTRSDLDHLLDAFYRIEVPLERDTMICHFNVVNNAPEGEGIAPVYVGVFVLRVVYPEYFNIIDPRFLWLALTFWRYFAENPPPEEPRMFSPPPPMKAISPEGRMLPAQIFALDRKLARLIEQLGLQEEVPSKSTPPKKPKKSPKDKPKKRSGK